MVDAGASVVAIDQFDFSEQFAAFGHNTDQLQFLMGDMQQLATLVAEQTFDIALCQRTIHYLSYKAARESLRTVRSLVKEKLFISVTGTGSLIGEVYPAAALPIEDRFAELSDLGKDMFSIREPVCLYNQAEFVNLLQSAGWIVDECWVSAFGNIKAVCSKG
jgi:hypothetical protein